MKFVDKFAILVMFLSISMLDSESYIPYVICLISVVYLLVRLAIGKLDV